MDYTDYSPEDFLSDESFLNYCFNKDQADIDFWEGWLRNHPERRETIHEARALCYRMGIRLSPEEKEAEWGKLQESIYAGIAGSEDPEGEEMGIGGRSSFFRRATPLLASVGAGLLFFAGIRWFNERFELRSRKPVVTFTSYSTGTAEGRRIITLQDGTVVLLNAGSRMEVPSDYNEGKREITLYGDAFFEAAPDPQQPFRVYAAGMVATALGTSFRFRAYPFEPDARVMLLTGKAEVKDGNSGAANPVYLNPGQEVTMDLQQRLIRKETFDTGQMEDWKAGRLMFKDATLPEIAATLQSWYGIKVILAGNIAKKIHFNGEFDNGKDLKQVLKTIGFINGMKYDLQDDTLKLMIE